MLCIIDGVVPPGSSGFQKFIRHLAEAAEDGDFYRGAAPTKDTDGIPNGDDHAELHQWRHAESPDPQVQRMMTLLNDARQAGEFSAVVGAAGSEVTVLLRSDHVVMPGRPTYLTAQQARELAQRAAQPAQGRIVYGRQTARQFAKDLLLVAAAVEHGVLQS